MARRPFIGPVIISQEYGVSAPGTRRGYHTGVDYALPVGTILVAPENGVVQENGDGRSANDGRGFYILFKGDSGIMHCLYHMRDLGTVTGRVNEGTRLGFSGNTGLSSGPHLHWETRKAPYSGTSDVSPGSWLFAGQPVYVPPTPVAQKDMIRIFGDYRTLYWSAGGARKAVLAPRLYPGGHLDYQILERSGVFVKIQTSFFGQGWLYVGSDVGHLTQYYKA